MQNGIAVSIAVHAGLLAGVLLVLATPAPFASRPEETISVDVVTPQEVPRPDVKTPQERPADQQTQTAASQPAQESGGGSAAAPPPSAGTTGAFLDPGALLAMYNMRLPGADFDAPAQRVAKLSSEDFNRFRAQLRKCWRLPAGVASSSGTQVVIRVALAQDGALMAEPGLVSASASREGPLVMQAAIHALEACQPYGFLPRERYDEWKVLDIGISPRQMAGG
ncbi:MAG: hypothetical protein IT538_08770 [Variibacter sp.]|nr:hypothetical protein [Variibacter sp.]